MGPGEFDLAVTALIVAEVVVGVHLPEIGEFAEPTLAAFLAACGAEAAVSALARALAYREANPTLSAAEKSRLAAAAALVAAAAAECIGAEIGTPLAGGGGAGTPLAGNSEVAAPRSC